MSHRFPEGRPGCPFCFVQISPFLLNNFPFAGGWRFFAALQRSRCFFFFFLSPPVPPPPPGTSLFGSPTLLSSCKISLVNVGKSPLSCPHREFFSTKILFFTQSQPLFSPYSYSLLLRRHHRVFLPFVARPFFCATGNRLFGISIPPLRSFLCKRSAPPTAYNCADFPPLFFPCVDACFFSMLSYDPLSEVMDVRASFRHALVEGGSERPISSHRWDRFVFFLLCVGDFPLR